MGRIEKTVFISYRRTNVPWALAIYQELMHHGYDVFFDYLSIDSGNFEKVILENIKTRAHFLVILTPSALERCKEPGDWLRREIETAMDEERNIVPLMLESFDFGSPSVKEALTGKLATLSTFNGLRVYSEYFFEAMDKLRDRYMNVEVKKSAALLVNVEAIKITETQKAAASEAAPVEEQELTAQEWFERGYVYAVNVRNFDEAIRCFSEAISLEPDFAEAYNNRGMAFGENGEVDKAITDLSEAVRLVPEFSEAYNNRASFWAEKGDLQKAIADYNEAILFAPEDADAYYNLGNTYGRDIGDLDNAILNFDEAIRLKPDYVQAYTNRGNARSDKGDLDGALADFDKAIGLDPKRTNAYWGRALILEKKKDIVSAIADYQKFLELENNISNVNRKELEKKIKELKANWRKENLSRKNQNRPK